MPVTTTLELLRARLGPAGVITAPDVTERYLVDQREFARGVTPAVLRPASTDEVVAAVNIVRTAGLGLVPQGGNTSYCGGATPDTSGRQFVLSLERMTTIRAIDPLGFTLSVDAGLVLAEAQAAAARENLMLPMSLGSEGSCRVGGILGTNAGGLSVLRYGMTRDLVLGVEAVLADGTVLNDMRRLRKNNTGYDVKQCFIGSEGTLGIITGVVFKLIPAPTSHATAWVKLAADPPLAQMLSVVRRETADLISSFEFITPVSLDLVKADPAATRLTAGPGGVLLLELSAASARVPVEDILAGAIEQMAEQGWIEDAFLAQGDRQRGDMWRLRETIPEGEKKAGGSVKHDISVPISELNTFLVRGGAAVTAYDSALRLSVYGHVGDGNLHYNVLVPAGEDRLAFSARIDRELAPQLYDISASLGGTFSAEHGVGRFKRKLMDHYADPTRRDLMRRIKTAFDPANTMNAGAVVDPYA